MSLCLLQALNSDLVDLLCRFFPVSAHADGQSFKQSRPAAGLHPHREKCLNRDQPTDPHSKNVHSLLWPHG